VFNSIFKVSVQNCACLSLRTDQLISRYQYTVKLRYKYHSTLDASPLLRPLDIRLDPAIKITRH